MEIQQIEKNELTSSQKAYQNLQKFRKEGTIDRDYKAELYAALEEKYICAKNVKADYIITRNIKDFVNSEVPAILPEDFLIALSENR